jgi:hypothetical protein
MESRGARSGLAAVLCLLASLLLPPVPASAAATNHVFDPLLSLTGGTGTSSNDPVPDPGPGHPTKPFTHACGVAVDPAGYVYVVSQGEPVEPEPGQAPEILNGRIDVFDPTGEFIVEIHNDHQPCSVAVDGEGRVYVVQKDNLDHGVVHYEPDSYPPAPTTDYGAPTKVVNSSQNSSIAVNQANDHLLVLDFEVAEYGSATEGNPLIREGIGDDIPRKDGSGDGTLSQSHSVAVDASSGDIFVSSVCVDCPSPIPSSSKPFVSVVYVFDSDGAFKGEIDGSDTPAGGFTAPFGQLYIAIDEANEELFVTDVPESKIVYRFVANQSGGYDYAPDPELEKHAYVEPAVIAVSNGDVSTRGNVYVTTGTSVSHLYVFTRAGDVTAPEVRNPAFSNPTAEDVSLSGEVNPAGAATSYRFEYIADASYRSDLEAFGAGHGFDHATVVGGGSLPAGNQFVTVSTFLAGLAEGTVYHFRVVASNFCKADKSIPCTTEGEERVFATFPTPALQQPCPNQGLRVGPSALLPDCRAYELVTPADTNGRSPEATKIGADTDLVSVGGDSLLFVTAGGSLPSLGGNGIADGYEAIRSPLGWSSTLGGPTGEQSQSPAPGQASTDHGYWFWRTGSGIDHGDLVIDGQSTTYVRLPDHSFRLVGAGPLQTDPRAQPLRLAPGGAHMIFSSARPLTPDSSPDGVITIYDTTADGATAAVSLKPDGTAPPGGSEVRYRGSSADGAAVAFTVSEAGAIALYERRSGMTKLVATGPTTFAGLSTEGARLTYLQDGDMFSFDFSNGTTTQIGSGGESLPVNVSADGSHVYFVSSKVLATSEGPVAGKNNFYVWDAESQAIDFIARLTDLDLSGTKFPQATAYGLTLWSNGIQAGQSGVDPSRTTPSGHVIVFESHAGLTGHDSSGTAQVYRYEAGPSPSLSCLSCSPSLAPPGGDSHLQVFEFSNEQAPALPGTPVRNVSDDGRFVFFQSPDPLVATDVDETEDVYEWEAPGAGGCARTQGCLALISSGRSGAPNFLYAATPSGSDVFFTTADLLTPADGDVTFSIYDARVNGGFPDEAVSGCRSGECRGEPVSAPALLQPSSSVTQPSRHCRKIKRKARHKSVKGHASKKRCAAKHRKRHHHHRSAKPGAKR